MILTKPDQYVTNIHSIAARQICGGSLFEPDIGRYVWVFALRILNHLVTVAALGNYSVAESIFPNRQTFPLRTEAANTKIIGQNIF